MPDITDILLTGASGFLGQFLKRELFGLGNVLTVGRHPDNQLNVDLCTTIPEIAGPIKLVVHAAGKAHTIPKTDVEKEAFFKVNVTGTGNLLAALERLPAPPASFVFISTVAVYGRDSGLLIAEDFPLNGVSPYAKSKIQAEEMLHNWCQENGVTLSILRLPLIVAENAPGNLGKMIKGIQRNRYLGIGTGDARKSMVLAADVAAAVRKVAPVGGIYNLTDGYHPSFKELEEVIARKYKKSIPKHIPHWFARLAAKVGDIVPRSPLNTYSYSKMAATLTFSDQKAKEVWGWDPNPVLKSF